MKRKGWQAKTQPALPPNATHMSPERHDKIIQGATAGYAWHVLPVGAQVYFDGNATTKQKIARYEAIIAQERGLK